MASVVPVPVRSAARERLDELLADGAWHGIEEAIGVMVGAVEPGKAYRTAERNRLNRLVDGSNAAGARSRGDEATAVAAGARSKAREVIRTATRFGAVERDGNRVRRTPGVSTPSSADAHNGATLEP